MSLKLKPEYKERWLAALRSGKYQQTRSLLHVDEGFCCLGVLCDVVKGDLGVEWEGLEGYQKLFNVGALLPRPVCDLVYEAGCVRRDHSNPVLAVPVTHNGSDVASTECQSLSDLNDDKGYTFTQIADLIERQL